MLRLILDRSCQCAGFAMAENDRVICKKEWQGGAMHTPTWFAEMATVIQDSGHSVAEVDEFVCGTGPGSFSGIRAALSALAGMALPGNKPVLGISSAAVLAYEYASAAFDSITVIGDARRSRLWCASYVVNADKFGIKLLNGAELSNTASDFDLIKADELVQKVPEGSLVISPDWDRIGDLLKESFSSEQLIKDKLSPSVDLMARLALQIPSPCRLEPMPIYLHPAVVVRS
ncbi:MAG: tRNA (adenosine(37)-N6)-threonylcarbamoyltransferase complex dimerization subunit type 1 TsaB [Kiritimatiellae bacterium]|jgi:tRNA threonylcarbamoyl adenosine modification protein YeaZ|nr:tRNA (adenosine(37)-N6)-threonylcarbamoyltransferase complex dimerization subunit type 1 TsaB [Kiritimatiellia bacterium]